MSDVIEKKRKNRRPRKIPVDQVKLFSRNEAAQMLSISVTTLEALIGNGSIKVLRIGARKVLISREEIDRFARRSGDVSTAA